MDIGSITAAYNGLKAGKELLAGFLTAKIASDAQAEISDALSKLGQAQDTLFELREELFALQTSNEELRKQIAQFENWQAQLDKYALEKTAGGAVVYVHKGDPEHFACPSCVVKRQLQILQDNRTLGGRYSCPGCKTAFPIKPLQRPRLG